MITQTPPRATAAIAARKRNRPAAASAPASSTALFSPSSVCSVPLFQQRHRDHNITGSPSPSIAGAAAAVSPFTDRPAFTSNNNNGNIGNAASSFFLKLEPVPEETNDNFNLSQDSIASSVTFASSNASGSHSVQMDLSCSISGGDLHSMACGGNGNNAMIGTMVGGIEESVVGCNLGASGSSSLSLDSYANNPNLEFGFNQFQEQQEWLPPTKRMRMMDPYELQVTQSENEDTMAEESSNTSPLSLAHNTCCGESKGCGMKMFGANSINMKMNIDKPHGPCCHVCSMEANSDSDEAKASAATCFNDVHQGHAKNAPASSPASAPRSHSLLSYFQPTKKQPSSHNPKAQAHNGHQHSKKSTVGNSFNLNPCRYCDKPTCISCTRQCEMCQHRFCTFCTKVDYESSITERILCFECDEYVNSRGDTEGGDYDMMDL